MSLKDAAHLQWPVDGPMGPSTTIGINWVQIAERFKTHKLIRQVKETTWDQTYAESSNKCCLCLVPRAPEQWEGPAG